MKKSPVRCMAGAYPMPTGDFEFLVVGNAEHGWFVWDSELIPDKFQKADAHVYELNWSDEHVEARLVTENVQLKLLLEPIWPVTSYVLTQGAQNFYSLRDRIREVGKEVSRTDWELTVKKVLSKHVII